MGELIQIGGKSEKTCQSVLKHRDRCRQVQVYSENHQGRITHKPAQTEPNGKITRHRENTPAQKNLGILHVI